MTITQWERHSMPQFMVLCTSYQFAPLPSYSQAVAMVMDDNLDDESNLF